MLLTGPGFEPQVFGSPVQCSTNWATPDTLYDDDDDDDDNDGDNDDGDDNDDDNDGDDNDDDDDAVLYPAHAVTPCYCNTLGA